jgi:predicted nucleic-acid-binding protein
VIGIDTNIILRLIVADEPRQALAARNFILEHCSADDPGYVSHIVLVELAWTLARVYGFTRDHIADAIDQILETVQLDVEASNDVAAAAKDYRKGPVGFADCLLARSNLTAECSHTVTFDRKAARLAGFKLLTAG